MTISSRTIAKNASFLMVSQMITWGLTFLVTIFLPRYLGPAGIGQLQLSASLWAIVAVIASLGTDKMVMKEIARAPDRLNELVSSTLALRSLLFMVGALGMAVYLQLVNYPPQTVWVVWIVGLSALIGQMAGAYEAGLKGLERMQYTSLASIVFVAAGSLLQIGLVFMGYGVIPIAAAGIFASMASLGIQAHFLRKQYSFKLTGNQDTVRLVFQASLPYFLVSIGLVLYHQVDIVIISLLADEKTIGWYGTAMRLFGTLLFIPNVFVIALFPALSRAYTDSPNGLNRLAQKSLNVLLLIGVPIGFGMAVLATPIIELLYGPAFANSGPVLSIMGLLLTLTYTNMLIGFLLISMNRQKTLAVVMLLMTFATIPLDLVLVPWALKTFANGALGGALSYVVTETAVAIAGVSLLPQGTFNRENTIVIAKLILAGSVMAAFTWTVRYAFLLIPIAVGAVTYIAMVLILQTMPREDWEFFFKLGFSLLHRLRRRSPASAELKG
jgi:O-antigen/teichoic acid export membrane protein